MDKSYLQQLDLSQFFKLQHMHESPSSTSTGGLVPGPFRLPHSLSSLLTCNPQSLLPAPSASSEPSFSTSPMVEPVPGPCSRLHPRQTPTRASPKGSSTQMHPFPATHAAGAILSPNTPNVDGTYTDPLVDLDLGSGDDAAREPHRARPQHAHDHVERPAVAIDCQRGRAALQAQMPTEDHLLPELANTFVAITRLWPEGLHKRLMVKFEGEGEDVFDYGGVSREWLFLLSHVVNPASGVNAEHLDYFKFIDRVLGLAVFHNRLLDAYFVSGFYKTVLNKKVDIIDVLDETLLLGRIPHIVVDLVICRVFDEHELELLIGGMTEIAMGDWMRFTDYRRYDKMDRVIVWFLVCLRSWPAEREARLLQFTTGTSRVPVNGPKRLQGGDLPCRLRSRRAGTQVASNAATRAPITRIYGHTRATRVWSANPSSWSSAFHFSRGCARSQRFACLCKDTEGFGQG
ncbi:hypothetical protein BJY52DRAFT_1210464 [Lactarius psammicola]|nr:hypothetical protein BJY52DRAFT_1210464 [Lactarius psammicola]